MLNLHEEMSHTDKSKTHRSVEKEDETTVTRSVGREARHSPAIVEVVIVG